MYLESLVLNWKVSALKSATILILIDKFVMYSYSNNNETDGYILNQYQLDLGSSAARCESSSSLLGFGLIWANNLFALFKNNTQKNSLWSMHSFLINKRKCFTAISDRLI